MMEDNEVLKLLVGKRFPVESFEEELGKILKKRSSAKLFISNKPDTIKGADGEFHAVNFKCVPQSASFKARGWDGTDPERLSGEIIRSCGHV